MKKLWCKVEWLQHNLDFQTEQFKNNLSHSYHAYRRVALWQYVRGVLKKKLFAGHGGELLLLAPPQPVDKY